MFPPSAHLGDAGPGERHDHGHHVDGQLELQELGDAVVDVPPPHDGLHNAGEVVIGQDDVRRLFCHICAGDSLVRSRGEGERSVGGGKRVLTAAVITGEPDFKHMDRNDRGHL